MAPLQILIFILIQKKLMLIINMVKFGVVVFKKLPYNPVYYRDFNK